MAGAPRWFEDALRAPRESREVEVEGCPIHYLRWGDPSRPGLVLVHGGGAHAEWWSFLAPLLTRGYHVAALDLSGFGDSGRRPQYEARTWVKELLAVADHAGMTSPPVLVGHSLGGVITIVAAAEHGDRLAGAVIVDAPVRRPAPESDRNQYAPAFRNPKTYPDRETAVARFRLVPDQPSEHRFIVDHVAFHSVHQAPGGGWTWKFDPKAFPDRRSPQLSEMLASVRTRVALFRGEHSVVVPEETSQYMYELLGRRAPVIEIPDAHHHLILDQPLAFIAALRTLLADWEHSTPAPRP
ncbi:MAG TPA: alpha/beta hydrolase [Myxococcaceae bacterium]